MVICFSFKGLTGLPCPCCPPRLPGANSPPGLAPNSPNQVNQINPEPPAVSLPSSPVSVAEANAAAENLDSSKLVKPPSIPGLPGLPNLPILPPSQLTQQLTSAEKDQLFSASVEELRRKAQEHSAALWQQIQQMHQNSNGNNNTEQNNQSGNTSGSGSSIEPFVLPVLSGSDEAKNGAKTPLSSSSPPAPPRKLSTE